MLDNEDWHLGLPDSIIQDIRQSFQYPERLPYFQLTPVRRPTLERKVNQLKDAGVVLMIGTDSGIPMKFHIQSTWNELDVWVNEFGFDPMYTIKAATYWPAKMMGVDAEYGTVSEGKYVDIIAVKGDVFAIHQLIARCGYGDKAWRVGEVDFQFNLKISTTLESIRIEEIKSLEILRFTYGVDLKSV